MTRESAIKFCYDKLKEHKLDDWHVRLTSNIEGRNVFLGLCSYKDKCIILNSHHIETHPEPEVENTILHEIAHALCPGSQHNETWVSKARELGCANTAPCSHLSFSPEIIDAIRSGADIKVEYETEIIHKPKYEITRLQDKCEHCGKVARSVKEQTIIDPDPLKPDSKFIHLECGHLLVKKIPKGTPFVTLLSSDNKKPYPFQIDGMRFIETALAVNKGAAIFDEMGLGKTIQALGYLKFHPEAFPVLFVVKSGIKFQWAKEILRWLDDMHVPQVISSGNDYVIRGLKCYIASYDIFVKKVRKSKNGKIINQGFDIQKFKDIRIKTIILDECQQIKNPDAARTHEVRKLARDTNVIALSGTPWKNRGSEFFSVLNMLAPMKFPSYQRFLNQWVEYYYQGSYMKMGGINNILRFREYIKDIAIRREIFEVMSELPEVNRTLHYCELDALSQREYDESVSEFVKWYNDLIIGGDEDEIFKPGENNILAKLARMRHVTGLAKIPATEEFCEDFVNETDRKLCIFVHHKDVGIILTENLRNKFNGGVPVLQLTSELDSLARFKLQEEFNNTSKAILIASTLASGEGLNLQTCADAIMHERQWNPQNEDQAAPGRFRRIGQEHKQVNVTFMVAAATVDETLSAIVEGKRERFHNTMNKGEMPVWNQNDLVRELADSLVRDYNKKQSKIQQAASV